MFKMKRIIKIIALSNKYLGYISQSTIYLITFLASIMSNCSKGIIVFECILIIIFIILIILINFISVILIFSNSISDDTSYDRNVLPTDSWTILYRFSAIIIPFYIWFVFIRTGIDNNNTLYILIWILQWGVLLNSFFYNAYLKQYVDNNR